MTIPLQIPLVAYTADGIATVYPFPFKVVSPDDLVVVINNLPVGINFTLSGIGDDEGAVTFATPPAAGLPVMLYRNTALKRDFDYQNNGDFRSDTVNADIDRAWAALQEQNQTQKQALSVPFENLGQDVILPLAADRATKTLIFDQFGSPLVSNEAYVEPSVALIQAKSYADALYAAGSPSGAGIFIQDGAGMVGRAINAKLKEPMSLLDASGTAPGLVSDQTAAFLVVDIQKATIRVPRGTHRLSSSISLKGHYTFEFGAVIQPQAGTTLTFNNAHIEAADHHQIFDRSLGGVITGKILNDYHSVCWFGADPTFTNLAGANVQQAIDSALTRSAVFPFGKYDMTGTQIKQAGVHVRAYNWQPGLTFTSGAPQDAPMLKWRTDMGAGAAQWWLMSYNIVNPGGTSDARAFNGTCLDGLYMEGPNLQNLGNGYTPNCAHDGIMLGSGGNLQMHLRNMTVTYTRFAYTAWATNGHSTFENMKSSFNWASWCMLSTGGDWSWTGKCIAGGDQLAVFYFPRNGTFGADPSIDYFYSPGVPYFFRQTTTLDPRIALASTNGISFGGTFKFLSVEVLGNAFAWFEPADSIMYTTVFDDIRWVAPTSSSFAGIPTDPTDYTFKIGTFNGCVFNGSRGGGGVGFWGGGTSGVFRCSVQNGAKLFNYYTAGSPVMTSPSQRGLVMGAAYVSPSLNFGPGDTGATYTMTADEAANNPGSMVPQYVVSNGSTSIQARCLVVGSTIVVTLASAVPGGGFMSGRLKIFGDQSPV